ncbi:MAG: hypothetical protein COA78_20060 [Blastopirellula sp.]|nr:MAG: hypothetical protein COA78_20060 [Blastopirellula sp.]
MIINILPEDKEKKPFISFSSEHPDPNFDAKSHERKMLELSFTTVDQISALIGVFALCLVFFGFYMMLSYAIIEEFRFGVICLIVGTPVVISSIGFHLRKTWSLPILYVCVIPMFFTIALIIPAISFISCLNRVAPHLSANKKHTPD